MKAAIAYRAFYSRNELCLLLKFDTVARCFACAFDYDYHARACCNAYLDNAATTPVIDEAIEAMNDVLRHAWGNPSSSQGGLCRERGARTIACHDRPNASSVDADEVFFTSGATEANNLAVRGACMARKDESRRIVTSSLEHASVTRSVRGMRRECWDVEHIEDVAGDFDMEQLRRALLKPTTLISVMRVQNELGWMLPVPRNRRCSRRTRPKCACPLRCNAILRKLSTPPAIGGRYAHHCWP